MAKQSGVGFPINKKFKNIEIKFTDASNIIVGVQVKLTSRYIMSITQVYTPSSLCNEEKLDNFYDDIQTTLSHGKSHLKIIMRDFNAKVC